MNLNENIKYYDDGNLLGENTGILTYLIHGAESFLRS